MNIVTSKAPVVGAGLSGLGLGQDWSKVRTAMTARSKITLLNAKEIGNIYTCVSTL